MIISQTPFRISFFGGATDYPAWFREHGGAVLSTTIDKYCYISCRPTPPCSPHRHRLVYSRIETAQQIEEIQHPAARATLQYFKPSEGLDIHYEGDLPARAGMGSSSAFTVGLVHALSALQGKKRDKTDLAKTAIHIEQDILREAVGSQDQISTAFGGFNRIDFHTNGEFRVTPLALPPKRKTELEARLMLFFTGVSRYAPEIAKTQLVNFGQRQAELRELRALVDVATDLLVSPAANLDQFGRLLHKTWQLKRRLAKEISTDDIDSAYNRALAAGALGGKILGAGGGGFLLFYAAPEQQAKVAAALPGFRHVPFRFEQGGSRITRLPEIAQ